MLAVVPSCEIKASISSNKLNKQKNHFKFSDLIDLKNDFLFFNSQKINFIPLLF